MPIEFWKVPHPDDALAAIDAPSGKQWRYQDLRRDVSRVQEALPRLRRKTLGMLVTQNRYECLVAYLAALNAGSALILIDAALNPELLSALGTAYEPDWVFALQGHDLFTGYVPSPSGID